MNQRNLCHLLWTIFFVIFSMCCTANATENPSCEIEAVKLTTDDLSLYPLNFYKNGKPQIFITGFF